MPLRTQGSLLAQDLVGHGADRSLELPPVVIASQIETAKQPNLAGADDKILDTGHQKQRDPPEVRARLQLLATEDPLHLRAPLLALRLDDGGQLIALLDLG